MRTNVVWSFSRVCVKRWPMRWSRGGSQRSLIWGTRTSITIATKGERWQTHTAQLPHFTYNEFVLAKLAGGTHKSLQWGWNSLLWSSSLTRISSSGWSRSSWSWRGTATFWWSATRLWCAVSLLTSWIKVQVVHTSLQHTQATTVLVYRQMMIDALLRPTEDLPYMKCPLHTVLKLTPVAYGRYLYRKLEFTLTYNLFSS